MALHDRAGEAMLVLSSGNEEETGSVKVSGSETQEPPDKTDGQRLTWSCSQRLKTQQTPANPTSTEIREEARVCRDKSKCPAKQS